MTMTIEKEASNAWNRLRAEIDELNSKGTEPPVYRAALTLPLTQAGITAVVGAIAEYPSGFTLFLLNTGGAGEVFLICAIDGVWRVWTVTPSSGGMPLIDPAVVNNFALQNADGSLYDAGFGAGAVGEDLVTAATVDGARGVLGLAPVTFPEIFITHANMEFGNSDAVGGFFSQKLGILLRVLTTDIDSRGRYRGTYDAPSLNRGTGFANWSRRIEFHNYIRNIIAVGPLNYGKMIFGKLSTAGFGLVASGNWVGWGMSGTQLIEGYVCKAGVVETVALTPTFYNSTAGLDIVIISDNGSVSWYANGTLVGSTINGPNASAANNGVVGLEIESVGADSTNYGIITHSFSRGY